MDALVEIRGLEVTFASEGGTIAAVRGASFDVPRGRTLAVIGESGSGKTTVALALLGLLPASARVRGTAMLRREKNPADLLALDPRGEALRVIRGREIGMVFQEPATALSPVYTIGEQIGEALRLHRGMTRAQARSGSVDALAAVGIPAPRERATQYAHELSGGMRQRAMIAIALAGEPALLLADEPTASLDVTVQAEILALLRSLQREKQMALMLITHDFGVVAELADEVVVMRGGEVVERADVDSLFHTPRHEYTRELLRASVLR